MIYNTLNLQKYNYNGIIIFYNKSLKLLLEELKSLNPIYITIINDFSFNNIKNEYINYIINDNDIIIPIKNINDISSLYIYKNKEIFKDLKLNQYIHINDLFNNPLLLKNYSFTIFKNNIKTRVKRVYHNYNIIGILEGETTIYLFNPKHKEDILYQKNNIKKWAHKKKLQKNDILFIPTNWFYIQETDSQVFQYHIDIDNLFTIIPNFLKSELS